MAGGGARGWLGERRAGPAGASGARGSRGRAAVGAGAGVVREDLGEEREKGGVRKREEVRVWLDLRVIIVCTNLKHWKVEKNKSCGRSIGFPGLGAW